MKRLAIIILVLVSCPAAFAQGYINFDNRANAAGTPGEFPGAVVAPIYYCDPTGQQPIYREGNTSTGVPAGSQTYTGGLLFNDATHHYTVTLWARNSTAVTGTAFGLNNLALVGTTTMRTVTSGTSAGRFAPPVAGNPIVPDVVPGSTDRATFQVRIWEDRGGTITTWDQALQTPGVLLSYSRLFTVPYALSSGIDTPPNLEGLQSFQMICVPEPSAIALGLLAGGFVLFLRRGPLRKRI